MACSHGAARVAAAVVVAACTVWLPGLDLGSFVDVGPRSQGASQGAVLIQSKPARISHEDTQATPAEEDLEDCKIREAELGAKVEALQKKLEVAERKCAGKSSGTGISGLCAAFGDPHFTTFDGAHTIMLGDQTLWLVRSQNIWVQALSRVNGFGNLMGLAVSGPFMDGHTLILANNSGLSGGASELFTVLFNDQKILNTKDDEGRAEFSDAKIIWAAKRLDWNSFFHDQEILGMGDAVDYDVGTWESRFSDKPKGGVYTFKFPQGVELTVTGSDLMSAVLRMAPQEGQTGYCGNFNGDAADEFRAPADGTVPEHLVAAWNIPVGEGLDPVPESLDLFRTSRIHEFVPQLLPPKATALTGVAAAPSDEADVVAVPDCQKEMLAMAEAACSKLKQPALHAACLIDVCQAGDPTAADGVLAVGVLEGEA